MLIVWLDRLGTISQVLWGYSVGVQPSTPPLTQTGTGPQLQHQPITGEKQGACSKWVIHPRSIQIHSGRKWPRQWDKNKVGAVWERLNMEAFMNELALYYGIHKNAGIKKQSKNQCVAVLRDEADGDHSC